MSRVFLRLGAVTNRTYRSWEQVIKIIEYLNRTFGLQHLVWETLEAAFNRLLFVQAFQELCGSGLANGSVASNKLSPQCPKCGFIPNRFCCLNVVRWKKPQVGWNVVKPRTTAHRFYIGMIVLDVLEHCRQLGLSDCHSFLAQCTMVRGLTIFKMEPEFSRVAPWIDIGETPKKSPFIRSIRVHCHTLEIEIVCPIFSVIGQLKTCDECIPQWMRNIVGDS